MEHIKIGNDYEYVFFNEGTSTSGRFKICKTTRTGVVLSDYGMFETIDNAIKFVKELSTYKNIEFIGKDIAFIDTNGNRVIINTDGSLFGVQQSLVL